MAPPPARRHFALALLLAGLLAAMPLAAQETGSRAVGASGLPLPRYASLAASQVNVRTGPSTDHPIRWVYERSGLPGRIVEESDVWRRIEDPDGETGWAHASLLSMLRTVLVRGPGIQELRRTADGDGRVVARLEPGVVATLGGCNGEWCRVEVAGERGWLPRQVLWGVSAAD